MSVYDLETKKQECFYEHASCPICGYHQEELSLSHFFFFNSHHGACPECHGIGTYTTFREEDVINPRLSLSEGALLPWTAHPYYSVVLEAMCLRHGIDMHIEYTKLSVKDTEKVLYGVDGTFEINYVSRHDDGKTHKAKYEGLIPNLERRYKESDMGNDTFLKRIGEFCHRTSVSKLWRISPKKEYLSVLV